jgi:hypothetical protein
VSKTRSTYASGIGDDSRVEAIVEENKRQAKAQIALAVRRRGRPIRFKNLWPWVLEAFMLREMNVKDICVELAGEGVIEAPWKADGRRKPQDHDMITVIRE